MAPKEKHPLNVIDREAQRRRKLEQRGPKTRLIPLVIRPGPLKKERTGEGAEDEEAWLGEEQRATEWLDLLYDLVIVAVLSVFSSNNEVTSPASILTYFSYIVLIWWVWASQTLYDVRFQANDWLHRLFKFLQLAAFAFIGVTSQAFDPANCLPPPAQLVAQNPQEAGERQQGATAFKGVAAAYGLSRLLCGAQYLYVAYATRQHHRLLALLLPASTCLLSSALNLTAAFLPSNPTGKVVLLYLPLGLEMLAMLVLPFFRGYIMLPVALVSERYGELTLVILGEGIIGVIKTLGDAVKGFGVGNAVYGQAICVLVIICCAWHFLFHGFNPEIRMGKKRGILWLLLHLPLHSVLLLLLAGMRNAVQYVNLGNAVIDVTDAFATLQAQGIAVLSQNGSGAFDTSQLPMEHLTVQFGKLPITTSFPDEVAFFEATVQQFPGNATVDPFIELVQYEVDALYWIAAEYSVEPSQELTDAYVRITVGTNSSWTPSDNDTLVQDTFNASMDEVSQLVLDFLSLYTTEVLEGTVYFLPTSGGLLILVSILNLLRSAPIGRWMWITWASHLIVGIGLALLGLLDLGGIEIKLTNDNVGDNHLSPVYRLLHSNMMIPTAAIAYAVLVLADAVFLSIGRRAEGGSLNKVAAEEAYSPSANGVREDDVLPLVSIGQTKRSDSPPERDGSDDERSWDGYQKGTSGPSLRMYGKVASEEEGQGKN